jgi:hypothetical protein
MRGCRLTVESVRVTQPVRDALPAELIIAVRNTSSQTIDAWGVAGVVSYANGVTRHVGVSTDAYETPFLPESFSPPSRVNKRLAPGAQASITTSIPMVPLTEPAGGTARPTFAIFEDDSTAGDEELVEFTFGRRRIAQQAWQLADEAVKTAFGLGLSGDQVLDALAKAKNRTDKELQQSYAFSIIRRSLAWKPYPPSTPFACLLCRITWAVAHSPT